jgi:DNA helicase II / ATP-dependent DNA helicase PcrA
VDSDPLSGLTERQKAAASHMTGPMLVLAGPGSGKTRVITQRIAHLVSRGAAPGSILALTFTNKAADEMRKRLAAMEIPRGTTLCTFHSLCARLLREFAGRAGLPEGFSIFDQGDQKSVLHEILKGRDIDPKESPPVRILRQIGILKNLMIGPDKVPGDFIPDLPAGSFAEIYAAYERRLSAAGALDFDDLLARTARLLRDDTELRERLSRRYRFILVDEYQDTNPCQYRIARALARDHDNLFVTGDPDQSIYGWRGADIGIILAFEQDFPGAPVVRLEENFRSTPEVLRLADDLIRSNVRRKEKRLIARKPGGSLPRLYRFADEYEEARGVAAWVRWMREGRGLDYGRIAVFYRVNAMSRLVEEELIKACIPYQIIKGVEFFERREIKDLMAYLRLLVNPADDVSLARVINRPSRGIGDTTVRRLVARGLAAGRDLWSVLGNPAETPNVPPAAVSRIGEFVRMIEGLRARLDRPVAETVRAAYERTGLRKAHEDEDDTDAVENVLELVHSALEYDKGEAAAGGLAGYLQQTALISDADAYREGSGAVSLMTLHTAKGLEFAAVMIIGVEDGILPHFKSGEAGRDIEEERRLLFVGITRAETHLALSHAQTRSGWSGPRQASLSPFLKGLAGLETVVAPFLANGFSDGRGPDPAPRTERYAADRSGAPAPGSGPVYAGTNDRPAVASGDPADGVARFRTGQRVRHPAIGPGTIEKVITDGRVIVRFENGARLTMDLGVARLEPLD